MVFAPKYRRKAFYGENAYSETVRQETIIKSEGMSGSAGGDPSEDECIEFCRFSESEKPFDGLRAEEQHIATGNSGARGSVRRKESP